jgi:hypothetical protein
MTALLIFAALWVVAWYAVFGAHRCPPHVRRLRRAHRLRGVERPEEAVTCKTCRWWKGARYDYSVYPHYGQCRVYPPDRSGEHPYPSTEGTDDWCGQHSPLTPIHGLTTVPPSPTST